MHIKRIEITNIRNIEKLVWELPDGQDLAGWHVLIGDNGSGKTTILRAIALGLIGIGQDRVEGLPLFHDSFLRLSADFGQIGIWHEDNQLELARTQGLDKDDFNRDFMRTIRFSRDINDYKIVRTFDFTHQWFRNNYPFSAAYGPFRRFTGGDLYYNRLFNANTRLAAHLSVFGEDVALVETIKWLQQLKYKQLENNADARDLLQGIKKFINHESFLPYGVRLEDITSENVIFRDANKEFVGIENLSDGYRSILGMILEVIRQMSIFYPNKSLFNDDFTQVIPPGVILIDEVDAHLHPSWQREIGRKLTQLFPHIQFIVTTHSPLVCQLPFTGEGDDKKVKGSIFRLPTPGTDEVGELLKEGSENWKRLVYGDIIEAYSTGLFGSNIERSPEAQEIIKELAQLSLLRFKERLTDEQKQQMKSLKDKLPRTPLNL